MVAQSRIDWSVGSLDYAELSIRRCFSRVPDRCEDVERGSLQPIFLPFIEGKLLQKEVVRQVGQEGINSSIFPSEVFEIVLQPKEEVVLSHQEHQLLQSSSSFLVGDAVEIGHGQTDVGDD